MYLMEHIRVAWCEYGGYAGLYVSYYLRPYSIDYEVIASYWLTTTATYNR